jgi:crotonobetainyl-CoA:carnitine CoA-transferase CaiB-like acyl-CoA transferase
MGEDGRSGPPGALDGVRVLDLSRVLAGPWATQTLGDLGAEVLKVERPGVGDDTRGWGPPFLPAQVGAAGGAPGDAAYFTCANRNKRSICVDFTTKAGADLIRSLVPKHQIFVENFKTGGLAKYGLDYPSLARINPTLVYCSVTGFGQTGPLADRAGYDYLVQGMGGLMSVTGQPDGAPGAEPLKVGVAVADLFTGMYATVAILAALRHAERTGVGQHLDLSLLDCQTAMLANQAANHLIGGVTPGRMGNAHPNIAPYQVFATADGHMIVAVGNNGQYAALCDLLGEAGLRAPEFATNAQRVAHREALASLIGARLATETTAHWIAAMEACGVPCGPINAIDQVFEEPQVKARGMVAHVARPDGARMDLVANPIKMSVTPPVVRRAPPALGDDTETALADLLGLDEAALAALRAQGAIG